MNLEYQLPAPLPFRDAVSDGVVAGLSLHDFRWPDTLAIAAEMHRVLRPGSLCCFQVNATNDINYSYGWGKEVEPNLFDLGGWLKRFFAEADCRDCFAGPGWQLLHLQLGELKRYGKSKQAYRRRQESRRPAVTHHS